MYPVEFAVILGDSIINVDCNFFQPKSKKVWDTSPSFVFEAASFVLSAAGIGTPNVEPIQQQLYDELLFSK